MPFSTGPVRIRVRPARPADLDAVNDMHRRCSATTRRARYLGPRERLTPAEWAHLTGTAYGRCFVVHAADTLIGYATLGRTADPATVEASLLVEDRWQGAGVGSALATYLVGAARRIDACAVTAYIAAGNPRALRMVGRFGADVTYEAGAANARLPLPRRYAAGVSGQGRNAFVTPRSAGRSSG